MALRKDRKPKSRIIDNFKNEGDTMTFVTGEVEFKGNGLVLFDDILEQLKKIDPKVKIKKLAGMSKRGLGRYLKNKLGK